MPTSWKIQGLRRRTPLRLLGLGLLAGCIDWSAINIKIVRSGDTVLSTDTGDSGQPDTGDTQDSEETATDTAVDTDTGSAVDTSWEPGPALGDDVLIYEGDGALPVNSGPYLIDGIDALIATYQALGAQVDESATLPDDLLPYRLIFWYMPGTTEADGYTVPETTTTALLAWFASGGRLLLAGDVDGSFDDYSLTNGNLTIDDVLDRLDVNIRLSQPVDHNLACSDTSSNALMSDSASLDGYVGNDVELETPAEWLFCDGVGVQVVRCGEVVVSGDVNPFSDHPEEDPQLVENLYTVPTPGC